MEAALFAKSYQSAQKHSTRGKPGEFIANNIC